MRNPNKQEKAVGDAMEAMMPGVTAGAESFIADLVKRAATHPRGLEVGLIAELDKALYGFVSDIATNLPSIDAQIAQIAPSEPDTMGDYESYQPRKAKNCQ